MDKDCAVQIENVVKEYRLGQIGSGTLRGDLQSFFARIRHRDDPNIPLLQDQYYDMEHKSFRALDGVSLKIKKGEAIGIIGKNGAGKSTLLKLISRITLPSEGTISFRGRVASLLEVGTGFNGELTGRENVYMNGAILGMSKAEIDAKMQQIIDFSEVEKFIDTPVKRYSSGMYVKLAFAVAAHLDSEILLMDEVLAVGDVKFQEKCLKRMDKASNEENRTVVYVSHNMATVRKFCERCVVLDKGKIIFDGETDKAIEIYTEQRKKDYSVCNDLKNAERRYCPNELVRKMNFTEAELLETDNCVLKENKNFKIKLTFTSKEAVSGVYFKLTFFDKISRPVATAFSEPFAVREGENRITFSVRGDSLQGGTYTLGGALVEKSSFDIFSYYDNVDEMCMVEIPREENGDFLWANRIWGGVRLPELVTGGDGNE